MRIGSVRALAIGLGLTALLAACGDDGTDEPGAGSAETSEGAQSPAAETPIVAASTVQLAETDLGEVLVDADGITLYLFQADADGTSTCYEDCEATWPPLIDEAPTAGDGIDEALLGTTERDDGAVQVTYSGQPLYTFASDEEPGDVEGQGVGDVWFVVDSSGDAITEEAPTGRGY